MDQPDWQQLLRNLVDALEETTWSSWQSTAKFSEALIEARETLERFDEEGEGNGNTNT